MKSPRFFCLIISAATFCLLTARVTAQSSQPSLVLSDTKWTGWTGVQAGAASDQNGDGNPGVLGVPGKAQYTYPDGPVGFSKHGFRRLSDSSGDWLDDYGIRAGLQLSDDREVELVASITTYSQDDSPQTYQSTITVQGKGWHTVLLPWTAFDRPAASRGWLRYVKTLSLALRHTDGGAAGQVTLRDVRVVKGPVVSVESEIRGKSAQPGQTVEYAVTIGNCTSQPQSVSLSFARYGWEAMEATVEPTTLSLAPNESKTATVKVKVADKIPPGGREIQTLQAIANGDATAATKLVFTTASALPHPYLLHTPTRWQEVRDKVKNYPWAKAALDEYVKQAEAWQVPEIARPPGNDPDDTMGPFLFKTANENDFMACGISWQLTGNKAYAEKIATFLRRLSDPIEGYAKTLRGCNQGMVQEGHFFQHIAMAYDMIYDSGVLTAADREQIEKALRIFITTIDRENSNGAINNWNVSELTGAFYCSLAMQDLDKAERFFSGPGGIKDQLAKGMLDDGWWYECAISYNVWCATEFTQVALAYEPWGVDLRNASLPASYSNHAAIDTFLSGGRGVGDRPFGMTNENWGPISHSTRRITDMWNSLLPFLDYRGVMFAVNDSAENKVSGQPFEIAYYVYRDPAYASVIKRGDGKRDLLYGVPELPKDTPEPFRSSATAANVGLAMLRSQTENRPIREQIQATLHFGSHGWAHGHYDRTNLLSLMRYGRSFYNPEAIWYGYEPFMYKFYVQTSVSHNMVVVDQKMQEPTESKELLFHSGKMMQASGVETNSRWSNPPYGGMVYDYVPVKTFEEKTWREGRYVTVPKDLPVYGSLTGFTEPVLQRRLMVVTDDYVILADHLQSKEPHTFDNLLQMKGFEGLEAADKKLLRHDAQWSVDPLSSAQFVTDANWWQATAPVVGRFVFRYGPDADNTGTRTQYNEPGLLKIDVHSLWPQSQQVMVAMPPEVRDVQKRLYYTVRGDGQTLAEGKFGAWILGQATIDVPVSGLKQLELQTRTELAKDPTLFWANARIVTEDGREIFLKDMDKDAKSSTVHVVTQNIQLPKQSARDYFGGPIKIVGTEYQAATPAEPQDPGQPGIVTINLSGLGELKPARFKAVIGGDYPLGNEAQRRKLFAVRVQGTEANFLTLLEPYEDKSVVKSATATGPDTLKVELNDGRIQELQLTNFQGDGQKIGVSIRETRSGKLLREEKTTPAETVQNP